MKVLCILTNGFEELEAVGTIALLRRAGIQIDIYARKLIGDFKITIFVHCGNLINVELCAFYSNIV